MTKEVLVKVAGLHRNDSDAVEEEQDIIEMFSPGTYYFKDGKHYIFYEEMEEGVPGIIKTQIRVDGKDHVEVIKKGAMAMHMVYEGGKKDRGYYVTPFGRMNLGIYTREILVEEDEEQLDISIDYTMDVEYETIAECNVQICVKSRRKADITWKDNV